MFANPLYLVKLSLNKSFNTFSGLVNLVVIGFPSLLSLFAWLIRKFLIRLGTTNISVIMLSIVCTNVTPYLSYFHIFLFLHIFSAAKNLVLLYVSLYKLSWNLQILQRTLSYLFAFKCLPLHKIKLFP